MYEVLLASPRKAFVVSKLCTPEIGVRIFRTDCKTDCLVTMAG